MRKSPQEAVDLDLKIFGQPLDYPYLLGVYLALNAIPDAALLVDGPDCAIGKAEHIFGKHDWNSSLLDCAGAHRVECTLTDLRNAAGSREDAVRAGVLAMAERKEIAAVFLSALPMTCVTGTDYSRIVKSARKQAGKPLVEIPARSLQGGYLDGYASALLSLAKGLKPAQGRPSPKKVAVVGYFMDRNEEDHKANLRELRRILGALRLELVSIWLDGSPYAELDKIRRAGTILAFPYGREAAAVVAKRTGAKVLKTGLPFGLAGTRRWVESLGRFCGRREEAKALVDSELHRIAPKLEWVVPHCFLNKKFWVSCDPILMEDVTELIEELGGRLIGRAVVGRSLGGRNFRKSAHGLKERPTSGALEADLKRAVAEGGDLFIGNSDVLRLLPPGAPALEFGFPSYFRHALSPDPFLGFEGCLSFVDRMAKSVTGAARPDRMID